MGRGHKYSLFSIMSSGNGFLGSGKGKVRAEPLVLHSMKATILAHEFLYSFVFH
jgi:hypothetical protein